MRKPILLLTFCLLILCQSFAQDIVVKKFELLEKDQSAVNIPRKDLNGDVCALVKVALNVPGAEFVGNVMGEVQYTGDEYFVYMTNGSKRLGIKHPDYLPTTIVFADYGTKTVASGATYKLKLKTNKLKVKVDNSKKGMVVFNIKPSDATLLIDGQPVNGDGGVYELSLPMGIHYYTVKQKDFSLNNQTVEVGKIPQTVDVDLLEFYAQLNVSCKSNDAELYVNNEQKGVGRWDGLVPPGTYTIEAKLERHHEQLRQVTLLDNDKQTVEFPALKIKAGSLRVDYTPDGSDVLLNGKKVGVTPLYVKEIPVGDYQMEIWKENYVKEFCKINIAEDRVWKETGFLQLTKYGELVDKEFWDSLSDYYRYGAGPLAYGDIFIGDEDSVYIPLDPIKSVQLLKKMANDENSDYYRKLLGMCEDCNDDAQISLFLAERDLEELTKLLNEEHEGKKWEWGPFICYPFGELFVLPYAALAWHYCYGVGCERDLEKAKEYLLQGYVKDGKYYLPALYQLVNDLGLGEELQLMPFFDFKFRDDNEDNDD